MHITRTNLPHSQVQLTIDVHQPRMVEYFARAYERMAPSVSIKGFRPGTAPKSMVLERIGIDRYTQEAVNMAMAETYYEAVQQEKVVPLSPPAIALHEFGVDSPLKFDATVDVLPSINLSDYRTLKVKLPSTSSAATDEEVTTVLQRLRQQAATFTNIDRGAKKGDRIEVHFTGTAKGAVQDDLTSQHYPILIGETPLIPGFEEQLIGLTKGAEKRFTLKVAAPQNTSSSAASKLREKLGFGARSVDFTIECLEVQEVVLPELTDEFSKTFGHDSVTALTEAIKAGVTREKQEQLRRQQEEAVLDVLRNQVAIDLPASLVEQEIARRVDHTRQQFGRAFDVFLKDRHDGSIEKLRESLRPEADRSVAAGLILGEIAQREQLVPAGGARTSEEQHEIMRKTLDLLINAASKK